MPDIIAPAEVSAILADFGLPATWRTIRPGIMTESGRPLTSETTDYACFAVILPREKEQQRTLQSDGTDQRESTSVAYVSAPEGLVPVAKDILIVGDREYRVEWLDLIQPAGTLLLITAGVQ